MWRDQAHNGPLHSCSCAKRILPCDPTNSPTKWKGQAGIIPVFRWGHQLRCFYLQSKSVVTQLCPALCNLMDCSPPGSCVHGILQARILEWVAIPSPGDLPNPALPLCRQILYHLSHQGSPLSPNSVLILQTWNIRCLSPSSWFLPQTFNTVCPSPALSLENSYTPTSALHLLLETHILPQVRGRNTEFAATHFTL